jgi:protein-disulfide isomerase
MARSLQPPVNEKDHVQGPAHARVELVEYGDYQCPHCGAAYPVIKRIQNKMGKHLKFVFRNFPLSEAHPQAFPAAVAAEAADRQNAFWEMHDIIFENQELLSRLPFTDFARTIGLDLAKFEEALQDQELADKVEADFASGIRSGVSGTPGFFINRIKYEGSWEERALLEELMQVMV